MNSRTNELEGERKVYILRQQTEARKFDQLQAEKIQTEKSVREKKDMVYQTDVEVQKCELRLQNILGQDKDTHEQEMKVKRFKQLQVSMKEKTEMVKTMQVQLGQVEVYTLLLIYKNVELNCLLSKVELVEIVPPFQLVKKTTNLLVNIHYFI